MKYAIIIGDGMADEPIAALNNKTPMEAANTPNMDMLAKKSELGMVKNVPETLPPGSDTAILSIFGCDPLKYYTGRSPLEAAGSGVLLKEGEISFRVNMVALSEEESDFNKKRIYSHSGDNIEGEDSIALMQSLIDNKEFAEAAAEIGMRFVLNSSFRHIGIAKDVPVPPVEFTPPHDILGQEIGGYINKPQDTVSKVQRRMMEIAYRVLNDHPINQKRRENGHKATNSLWFWGAGKGVELPDFEVTYEKTATAITAVPLVEGIAALSNVKNVKVEGANGELNTNYKGKVDAALEALKNGDDLAIVHVEAPDEMSHMGDMAKKLEAIELLDSKVVGPMLDGLKTFGEFRLLILPDHPTLLKTRTHDGAPVPYLLFDSRKDTGCGLEFTERNAAKGIYNDKGCMLIAKLLSE